MAKLTQVEFIDRCNGVHQGKYNYHAVDYCGMSQPITVTCPTHGPFKVLAGNHLYRKSGCPHCARIDHIERHTDTRDDFECKLEKRNATHPPVKLIGEYTKQKDKTTFECAFGHQWTARPADILNGHGCPECAQTMRQNTTRSIHGYKTYTQRNIADDVLSKLKDPTWLTDQHHTNTKTIEKIAGELGVSVKCVSGYFDKGGVKKLKFATSQPERELVEYIRSLNILDVEVGNRSVIAPLELDIFIPTHNLAIELNGIKWHSEGSGRSKYYHLYKTKLCTSKGIRLLHFWDTEWIHQRSLVESMIQNALGCTPIKIGARSCRVQPVPSTDAITFLNANHLQGACRAKINYGLYYGHELVALMTFGAPRFSKHHQFELVRYCSKVGTIVQGGAGKLHAAFVANYDPSTIVSYSDMRIATGNMYRLLGYAHTHTSAPNYHYFHPSNYTLRSRIAFQKHKLQSTLPYFDPNITEWENMQINGYDRVWDCGNNVYVWTAPDQ